MELTALVPPTAPLVGTVLPIGQRERDSFSKASATLGQAAIAA